MKQIVRSEKVLAQIKDILAEHTSHSHFRGDRKSSYAYTKLIGVTVCPYCNMDYIHTVFKNGKYVTRPDIDHFETQASHKEKELDPDNLIPSCLRCNMRIKHRKSFYRDKHIHPFFDDFDSIMRFCVDIKKTNYEEEEAFSISLVKHRHAKEEDVRRAKRSIKDLKLVERYDCHKRDVTALFKKIKYYHRSKQQELRSIVGNDAVKLLSALFPERYAEDIANTSLGKLKADIYKKYL